MENAALFGFPALTNLTPSDNSYSRPGAKPPPAMSFMHATAPFTVGTRLSWFLYPLLHLPQHIHVI